MTDGTLDRLPRVREAIEAGIRDGLHLGAQIYVSLKGETVADGAVGGRGDLDLNQGFNRPVLLHLSGDRLAGLHQGFEETSDTVLGHRESFSIGVALCDATGKRRYRHYIAALFGGFQMHGVGIGLHDRDDSSAPRTFGHSGYRSSVGFADPERGLAVALAFNGTPSNERHEMRVRSVLDAVYEDLGVVNAPDFV